MYKLKSKGRYKKQEYEVILKLFSKDIQGPFLIPLSDGKFNHVQEETLLFPPQSNQTFFFSCQLSKTILLQLMHSIRKSRTGLQWFLKQNSSKLKSYQNFIDMKRMAPNTHLQAKTRARK